MLTRQHLFKKLDTILVLFSVQYQGRTWSFSSQLDWANNVISLSQSFKIQDGSQENNPRTLDNFLFPAVWRNPLCFVQSAPTSEIRTFDTDSERFCVTSGLPLLFSPSPSPLPLKTASSETGARRNKREETPLPKPPSPRSLSFFFFFFFALGYFARPLDYPERDCSQSDAFRVTPPTIR